MSSSAIPTHDSRRDSLPDLKQLLRSIQHRLSFAGYSTHAKTITSETSQSNLWLQSRKMGEGNLQSSHASARRMNSLVYMRSRTARVPNVTHKVMVKMMKMSRFDGSWKLDIIPVGGLIAGPSSSFRSAA